ncbi:hypothetical protein QQ045_028762 [Rhodiola kirilowii]
MSFISVVSLASTGLSEIRGKHLQYSKFWNANLAKSSPLASIKLSGRAGMALFYAPAMVAALASFVIYPDKDVSLCNCGFSSFGSSAAMWFWNLHFLFPSATAFLRQL